MRLWVAILLFCLVLLFTQLYKITEGFQQPQDFKSIFDLIRQIQLASGQLNKEDSYNQWVGYLYKNVNKSAKPLNDFKARVFWPTCEFRYDWATNIPQGLSKPVGANDKQLANAAYSSYLKCLKEGTPVCVKQLEDARTRFMKPGCSYSPNRNIRLTNNLTEVFT